MTILVTGSAGFIGSALTLRLLADGHEVIGIDNHNGYYNPALKEARLARHADHPAYTHIRADIADRATVAEIFATHRPSQVIHLAAQAGVRHSLKKPFDYVDANLVGFANILEGCRHTDVEHLVFASSSSVYGGNRKLPYVEADNVDHPLSLYAATKKANELMAHAYSHLYSIPATGLRFFTVYGPWDRPDMALQRFANAIIVGRPIELYNYGRHRRDWTFIDDIIEGIVQVLVYPPKAGEAGDYNPQAPDPATSTAPWRALNIGRGEPIELLRVVELLERALGREAERRMLPMQPGDVEETHADITRLRRLTGYTPRVSIEDGIAAFARWYQEYVGRQSRPLAQGNPEL